MATNFLPLRLFAKRGNWQRFNSRKANKVFQAVRDRVLARDNNTCRYCGFALDKYQEIVNIDQDYSHNTLDNMATACSFCSACLFIDSIGVDGKTGGIIIHLPELSQTDLNHFSRALFCSLLRDAPYKGKLQSVYLTLQDRGKIVEDLFGPRSQEPHMFGESLIDCGLDDKVMAQNVILSELKFLPIRKYYKEQAEYWRQTVFSNIPL